MSKLDLKSYFYYCVFSPVSATAFAIKKQLIEAIFYPNHLTQPLVLKIDVLIRLSVCDGE